MSLGPFGLLLLRFHLEDVELVMLLFAPRFAVVALAFGNLFLRFAEAT
jgi:hypothetical protein